MDGDRLGSAPAAVSRCELGGTFNPLLNSAFPDSQPTSASIVTNTTGLNGKYQSPLGSLTPSILSEKVPSEDSGYESNQYRVLRSPRDTSQAPLPQEQHLSNAKSTNPEDKQREPTKRTSSASDGESRTLNLKPSNKNSVEENGKDPLQQNFPSERSITENMKRMEILQNKTIKELEKSNTKMALRNIKLQRKLERATENRHPPHRSATHIIGAPNTNSPRNLWHMNPQHMS